jgi:hypothetical protein
MFASYFEALEMLDISQDPSRLVPNTIRVGIARLFYSATKAGSVSANGVFLFQNPRT